MSAEKKAVLVEGAEITDENKDGVFDEIVARLFGEDDPTVQHESVTTEGY